MKEDVSIYDFDANKNRILKKERNISFEEIISAIEKGGLLDIIKHSDPIKYPSQRMYVVNIENYAYVVPFVKEKNRVFLKTIFPSRKATKIYLNRKSMEVSLYEET